MKHNQDNFQSFVNAVNAHDTAAIGGLLDVNHILISSDGVRLSSHAAMNTWQEYFRLFPNFSLEITSSNESDTGITAFGYMSGSLLKKTEEEYAFKIPVAFRTSIEGGKLLECQIYAHDQKIRDLIAMTKGRDRSQLSVQGLGGVFFKSKDPKSLCAWYDAHLGTKFGEGTYAMFEWRDHGNSSLTASTTYAIFDEKSEYFAPGKAPFMFNFRVNNLDALIEKLKAENVQVIGEIERFDYGNFGWIMDPDGNKIELWEAIDGVLEEYEQNQTN